MNHFQVNHLTLYQKHEFLPSSAGLPSDLYRSSFMRYALSTPPLHDIRAGAHQASTEVYLYGEQLYQTHKPLYDELLVST